MRLSISSPVTWSCLFLVCAGCCCHALSPVLNGYQVHPVSYETQDGLTWNASTASERDEYSDTGYNGTKSGTGKLSGGLGRLTDGIAAAADGRPNVWMKWRIHMVHKLVFKFPRKITLCQVDVTISSPKIGDASIELYYEEDEVKYPQAAWGRGTVINTAQTSTTLSIPRQFSDNNMPNASSASDQVNVYVDFAVYPNDVALSEVVFWECGCPIPSRPSGCRLLGLYGAQVPCSGNVRPDCPQSKDAQCVNNYCTTESSNICNAEYVTQPGQLFRCPTPPTESPTTAKATRPPSRLTAASVTTVGATAATSASYDMRFLSIIGALGGVLVVVLVIIVIRACHYRKARRQKTRILHQISKDDGPYSLATLSRQFENSTAFVLHYERRGSHSNRNSHCSHSNYSTGSLTDSKSRGDGSGGSSESCSSQSPHYKMPRATTFDGKPIALTSYSTPRPANGWPNTGVSRQNTATSRKFLSAKSQSMLPQTPTAPCSNRVQHSKSAGDVPAENAFQDQANTSDHVPTTAGVDSDEYVPMKNGLDGQPMSAGSYEMMNSMTDQAKAMQLMDLTVNEMKPTPPSSAHGDTSSEGSRSNENVARRLNL